MRRRGQLVFAVVPRMSNFMALLGLAIGGFAVSFMLVFNIATTDVGNWVVNQTSQDKNITEGVMSVITIGNTLDGDVVDEDVVQFGNLPVSFFRCVTRCCLDAAIASTACAVLGIRHILNIVT